MARKRSGRRPRHWPQPPPCRPASACALPRERLTAASNAATTSACVRCGSAFQSPTGRVVCHSSATQASWQGNPSSPPARIIAPIALKRPARAGCRREPGILGQLRANERWHQRCSSAAAAPGLGRGMARVLPTVSGRRLEMPRRYGSRGWSHLAGSGLARKSSRLPLSGTQPDRSVRDRGATEGHF